MNKENNSNEFNVNFDFSDIINNVEEKTDANNELNEVGKYVEVANDTTNDTTNQNENETINDTTPSLLNPQ